MSTDIPKEQFLIRAKQYGEELRRNVEAIAAGSEPAVKRARMRLITHRLAGSGGFFGYDLVSDRAAALEDALLDNQADAEIARLTDALLVSLP